MYRVQEAQQGTDPGLKDYWKITGEILALYEVHIHSFAIYDHTHKLTHTISQIHNNTHTHLVIKAVYNFGNPAF